jgi:hypothetical protein
MTSTSPAPLPPPETKRWSPRRKAEIVAATRAGIISRAEAYERYQLSPEELASWEAAFDRNGVPGLRVTRHQIYRDTAPRRPELAPPGQAALHLAR